MPSKISLEKSWKFTSQTLFLIVFGIFVISISLISVWQLSNIPFASPLSISGKPKIPETNTQMPEGPLYGIWGNIISLSTTSLDKATFKTEEGLITLDSDYLGQYKFAVNENTLIRKYSMGGEGSPVLLEKNFSWRKLKAGDRIYFYSADDLLAIHEPKTIYIEIYVP